MAATLLLASARISDAWPGGYGILSSALAPAVPALVELAVAVIRSPAAACSYQMSEMPHWDVEVSNPLQAAVVFTWCFARNYHACLTGSKAKQLLQQLAGSATVGELLLLALGLTAQLQHEQKQGLSPAPAAQQAQQEARGMAQQQQRQQLVVPPYHQQLLKVLGLPGRVSGMAQVAWARCPPTTVIVALWGLATVTLSRPDLKLLPNRHDSSSPSSSSQQAQQAGQQAATGTGVSAFVPVLLVVVEIEALQPGAGPFVAAAKHLTAMLQSLDSTPDGKLELLLAKHLLPAVVGQLLPAAKHAAAPRSQPGPDAASEQERLQLLEVHLPALVEWLMVHAVNTAKGAEAAAAVFAQHTEEYSALLQAALRHSLQCSDHPHVARQLALLCVLLRNTADSTVLEAVSAGRQLPLLLVSLLKALVSLSACQPAEMLPAGAASSDDSSKAMSIIQQDLLRCAHTVMLKLPGCLRTAGQAASTAANSSSNHSQRQLLAVLLARCLVAVGRLLQARMQRTTSLLAAPAQEQLNVIIGHQQALLGGEAAVDALVEELQSLAAALPAQLQSAALQQLADEHVQPLKAAWQDLQAELPQAPVAVTAAAILGAAAARQRLQSASLAAAEAALQLEAFGAAVAGLLPLPDCCNYHACSSASRVSEGELVSGNSCVCGGCGVARYCSRECQVAHYKGWHKAVCKRLKQQQQQQQ